MKGQKITMHFSMVDSLQHTRSAFANMHISGCGAHKSKKDYNRQASKKLAKKALLDY